MKVGEMATDIMATSTTKLTHSIYFAPSSLCAGLRMINMILSFESNRVEFFDHHKINVTQFKIEDQSAATIRRCWNSHKSRGAVFSLILQTRAIARRKRIEAERLRLHHLEEEKKLGLEEKAKRHTYANVIRRAFRCHNFYMRFNKRAFERKEAKLKQQVS